MSGSFDAEDVHPTRHHSDEHTTPSTPVVSASQLSTPRAINMIINTPPATAENSNVGIGLPLKRDSTTTSHYHDEIMTSSPPVSSPHHTPSMFSSNHYDALEPPHWKPPNSDEIEYTDAWNNTYNTQHHYLKPAASLLGQDDSTVGSSHTNSSFGFVAAASAANNLGMGGGHVLRPRGFSVSSYKDDTSIGSCPQPPPPQHTGAANNNKHRRHPSLPMSFCSSKSKQQGGGGTGSNQQLFLQTSEQGGSPHKQSFLMGKQFLNSLQSTTKKTPYELHSHHNASQVKADATMAGLSGVVLDLYMVDRSVDSSSARMMAVNEEQPPSKATEGGGNGNGTDTDTDTVDETFQTREDGDNNKCQSSNKSRKTAIGTLNDIQCILELHRVDKLVDRFKQDLQMPEFFEEEAWESSVWKDLRQTDVEMEEYAQKKKSKENKENDTVNAPRKKEAIHHYQLDLSDSDEEGGAWSTGRGLSGEDIYMTVESRLTDYDAYQFFDPHEMEALHAHSYQTSHVSASMNDDLQDVIDLLRVDVEVDGASKRHGEMEMIRPLFEMDREMNRWKAQSKVRDMWVGDLKELYMTDLEVDRVKSGKKVASKPRQRANNEGENPPDGQQQDGKTESNGKMPAVPPPVHPPESAATAQEVKDMLTQHIPSVPQQFVLTSPELMASKTTFHGSDISLNPPPPVPFSSPQSATSATRRAIIFSSAQEKTHDSAANIEPQQPKATTATAAAAKAKRSIFSREEKSSAAKDCGYQRGVMPGTTTVVHKKGGEMIGDIPVGKIVMR